MINGLSVRRVLIVDDEPELRDILSSIVSSLGIECETAANGQEALDCLRDQTFHAVLCDINMPIMSGIECLRQAQATGNLAPFIFVTAFGDATNIVHAVRLGAVDFFQKPFDRAEISEVIMRALEIGVRRERVLAAAKNAPGFHSVIQHEEHMIALLRCQGYKKPA